VSLVTGYDGAVTVGGPAQTRQVDGVSITKVAVGPMENNAYLLRDQRSGAGVLIDAADEPERLIDLAGDRLDLVVTTHRHADHWQGLAQVIAATGAGTAAGRADVDGIPVPTDRPLDDNDVLTVGAVVLRVRTVAGHTPGGIVLSYRAQDGRVHLFTGDSLFPGGVGHTWSPDDFTRLLDDVETKIFAELPDDTWVYPGHGADTTLGAERPDLPAWRARGW
jgi:glyoxylase-like metal-dependent hydrolase (beta-lactamase superfamily II)